ncbi:MAG TPA: tetratricopeptide repeat protein [Candidatus Acidoferrum sp.]|nr:tetratricopeptide repeat protein [Candidatus Acidoferrum sp.]
MKVSARSPFTNRGPTSPKVSLSPLWLGVLLAVATIVTYLPALRGGFIWDDDDYVTQNAMLTAPDGLTQIWFSAHHQSQYFPLVYTTLRFERALWGLSPLGYHAVNVLLHAANALLLWQLLRRLVVPGAWLGAAIFALHPVQVESVAWITELKNVQSTLFYLLALLAWVKFTDKRAVPWSGFYWLALLFHACALFSKTTACTLPAALWLILWWRGEAIGWRRMLQILPFLLMGLGMGLLSVWWEKHLGNYVPASGAHLAIMDKMLVATRAVWFYAAKVFWPVNLSFSYPRWEINARAPLQYLGLLGCVMVALLLWWHRHVVGRGVTAGVVFFVAALSPLLGFIPLYTFRYSFVADHYQYLACAGLIVPFAAVISSGPMTQRLGRSFWRCLAATLLATLGVLTWNQSHIYADEETLWRDTLVRNPGSCMAHANLGSALVNKGRFDEAISHLQESLRLRPDDGVPQDELAQVHNNLGIALVNNGHIDDAVGQLEQAIHLQPDHADAHYNLGIALAKAGRGDDAISQYREVIRLQPDNAMAHYNLGVALARNGEMDEAISHYQEVIRLKPDCAIVRNDLGSALFKKGHLDEAISHYQQAIRLRPDYAMAHYNLGNALAKQGQLDEAIREFQEALRLQPDYANARRNLSAALAAKAASSQPPGAPTRP